MANNPKPRSTNKPSLGSPSSSSDDETHSGLGDTSQTITPDGIDIDDDRSSGTWEEYDISKFGSDVMLTGASSSSALSNTGPQAGPSQSVSESQANNRQSTPLFGDMDNEIEILTSSQRSF